MPAPASPFKPVILVLVVLDAVLLLVFVGAQVYDQVFPTSCPPPAHGSKIELPCITPAQTVAGGTLFVLAVLVPCTFAVLVLSQTLLLRRARRSQDAPVNVHGQDAETPLQDQEE